MPGSSPNIEVALEAGSQRVFASALEWPGWTRAGRSPAAALQALVDYGPRYARVLRGTRLGFRAPIDVAALTVVETIKGDTTTDFGAPGLPPAADARPVDETEVRRLQTILKACWRALDAAAEVSEGQRLSVGPRGGGRQREDVLAHVQGGDASYLSRLAGTLKLAEDAPLEEKTRLTRQAILKALPAAARGEFPTHGPRGGARWTPRYFTRRAAWHVLDHAWEIEDRLG
jgi:hypothetical protein